MCIFPDDDTKGSKSVLDCGPLEHDAKVVYSHVVHSYDVIGNDVKEGSNFTLTEAAEIMSGDNVAQVL